MANENESSLSVQKIQNGTVIDRVDAFKALRVLQILSLLPDEKNHASDFKIAILINVPSKKLGKKDIIKIEGNQVPQEDLGKIALVSPNASINLIKNSKVEKKQNAFLPNKISGIASCPNPGCISFSKKEEGKFSRQGKGFRCHYCERIFDANELVL